MSSKDFLLQLGFQDVGSWSVLADDALTYSLDQDCPASVLEVGNALYAFCLDDEALYIGKTCRSLRQRLAGYKNPGPGQKTNIHVNAAVRSLLRDGRTVRIFAFVESHCLEWGGVPINLPAGLEDGLIDRCQPAWNKIGVDGGTSRRAESESFNLEGASMGASQEESAGEGDREPTCDFEIRLGVACYEKGIINPGVEASRFLGSDGSPVMVHLGGFDDRVDSFINRRANPNHSVRIVGSNRRIAEWFQAHFRPDEVVRAAVLRSGNILLCEGR